MSKKRNRPRSLSGLTLGEASDHILAPFTAFTKKEEWGGGPGPVVGPLIIGILLFGIYNAMQIGRNEQLYKSYTLYERINGNQALFR